MTGGTSCLLQFDRIFFLLSNVNCKVSILKNKILSCELQSSFDLIREWPKAWCCCHKEIKRVALLSKFEFIFLGHLRCDQRYATCVSSVLYIWQSPIFISKSWKLNNLSFFFLSNWLMLQAACYNLTEFFFAKFCQLQSFQS